MNNRSLSITFVLPGEGHAPVGGYKVVYEYANALVRRGHRVSVVHPAYFSRNRGLRYIKGFLVYLKRHLDGRYRPDMWFRIDPRVRLLWKPSLRARHIPDGDIVVATWWTTAEAVALYKPSKGKQFYLLQHLETWGGPEERVLATWRLPMHKIVIARWLQEIADEIGQPSTYIPNGLDFSAFGMDVKPEMRNPNRVMMLYHNEQWKGSADGLTTLQVARQQVSTLEADIFGVYPAPKDLPSWMRYHRNPPQPKLRQLYSNAAIFLAPSWTEGWPLPPAEAMMSGCALVATDIGGHREYCIAGQTALLNEPKEPGAMAHNLIKLLTDQEQRIQLAHAGHDFIQQFTWDRAVVQLELAFRDEA